MIENSMFYYQLKTNGYTHAWKEIYTKINAQCNALGIPFKNRMALYLKEIEYLSLLLHDILPSNYSEQGMVPGDTSTSSHHTFFSQKDSITIAHKKWYDILDNDYDFFWDVHSSKIDIDTLSNYDIVKLNDLLEIIWFINPMGLHNLIQNIKDFDMVKLIRKKANFLQHWVPSRHDKFYTWMMFGWRPLPNVYPSFDSAGPLNKIDLSRWVPKAFSLEDLNSNHLYFVEKKLSGNVPT